MRDLNEKQKEAAQTIKGPLLIVAGAGAGKTKTITERILNLINQGVPPKSILAVTFTNKAAEEMRNRVFDILTKNNKALDPMLYEDTPFIGTFHALGVKIIRENHKELVINKYFSIFDREDSKKAVKEAMKKVGVDYRNYGPGSILHIISRKKGELKKEVDFKKEIEDGIETHEVAKIVHRVWQEYEKILEKEKALDFDDLILKTVELLSKKEVLNYYQNFWQYINIDEYQDTNEAQYTLINLLANKNRNICAVGDADQCIYSWRGAKFRNILNFEKDYPEAKTILLEENYRSTQNILDAANQVIKRNIFRIEKNLYTRKKAGEKLVLIEGLDENQEAQMIAEKIRGIMEDQKAKVNQIAVLYRANFQSRALEEAFMNTGIPYQVLGTKFFERKEIKDIISFIRVALNPDSHTDLKRIINLPPRGVGKVTLLKIISGKEDNLNNKLKEKVQEFRKLLKRIKDKSTKKTPSQLIKFILEESGLKKHLENGGIEEKERLENILELINLAERYGTLPPEKALESFLADIALVSDQDSMDKKENSVKLMTVHASKGLEFDYVFVTGLEENLFPYQKTDMGDEEKEEERRLFYVALTRARKKVFLSYSASRGIFGTRLYNNPSPFIFDISPELLEKEEQTGFVSIEF